MTTANLPPSPKPAKSCSIEGCNVGGRIVKGFCYKHYYRFKTHGDPLKVTRRHGDGENPVQRFWSRCSVTSNPDKCWEWYTGFDIGGYAAVKMTLLGRKWYKASRVAYFFFYGVDPADDLVLHECDNRKCVNPKHLFLGDHKKNTQDMMQKGRAIWQSGEENHMAKLTADDVRLIRANSKEGRTQESLAAEYGVSASAIGHIRQGTTWRHVK